VAALVSGAFWGEPCATSSPAAAAVVPIAPTAGADVLRKERRPRFFPFELPMRPPARADGAILSPNAAFWRFLEFPEDSNGSRADLPNRKPMTLRAFEGDSGFRGIART